MNPLQKITELTHRARKMRERLLAAETRLNKAEEEMVQLKERLQLLETEKQQLEEQIKIIKLARNIGQNDKDKADVTELKRKINEYIRELDSCMAMLND